MANTLSKQYWKDNMNDPTWNAFLSGFSSPVIDVKVQMRFLKRSNGIMY